MTNRETAMKWWNSQSDAYKESQYNQYEKEFFTPANNWKTLTGREIEKIYFNLKLSERAIKQ